MKVTPDLFTCGLVCKYLPYFSVGYLVRKNREHVLRWWYQFQHKGAFLTISVIVWGISIVMLERKYSGSIYINFIASLTGLVVLIYLSAVLKGYRCEVLKDFAQYSLQLYLLNGFLLVVSRTFIVKVMAVENPFIIIGFNMLVTLLLSWLFIKYIISRFKICRFLLGIV